MRKNRQHPVSTGAMADVAFLLLVFFLVATQIYDEEGIQVTLPRIDAAGVITEDAVFHVHINGQNEILAGDQRVTLDELSPAIYNAVTDEDFLRSGKALISIHCDRGTKYETYVGVYDHIRKAFHKIWDETSTRMYSLPFHALEESQKQAIREQVPMVVSEAEWTGPAEQ